MTNNQILYLTEVLGLNSFLRPRDFHKPGDTNSSIDQVTERSQVLVISNEHMTNEEKAMAEKMLMSVGLNDLKFFSQNELVDQNSDLANLFGDKAVGVFFGNSEGEMRSGKWLNLPQIDQFLDDSKPSELVQLKKDAWGALKKFKKELCD